MEQNFLFIERIPCKLLKYEEGRDKQTSAIVIKAIIKMDHQTLLEIKKRIKGSNYYEVTLPNSGNNRIPMRFGKILWDYRNEAYTMKVAMVEDIYDNVDQATVFDYLEPELSNTRNQTAKTAAYVIALENILIAKNILTPTDLEILRHSAKQLEHLKLQDLYRVENVFDYWED